MKLIYTYALMVWVLFVVLASINGIVRDTYYEDIVGELYAHQISSVILIFVMLLVMHVVFNKFRAVYTKKDLWLIGAGWLVLTVLFEIILGHYILGDGWGVVFADYDIFSGRLWLVVLGFVFVGPWLVARN